MTDTRSTIIESWFASCPNDGDFVRSDGRYECIESADQGDPFIYTTKAASISHVIRTARFKHCGMVARYGLPNPPDTGWLVGLLEHRTCYFLGDMDPADLMIFAWLSDRVKPIPIKHLGITDTYIAAVGATIPEAYTIKLSNSERESLAVLEDAFPDYRDAIGPRCAQLLTDGRKLEIEAVVSAAGNVSDLLRPIGPTS